MCVFEREQQYLKILSSGLSCLAESEKGLKSSVPYEGWRFMELHILANFTGTRPVLLGIPRCSWVM